MKTVRAYKREQLLFPDVPSYSQPDDRIGTVWACRLLGGPHTCHFFPVTLSAHYGAYEVLSNVNDPAAENALEAFMIDHRTTKDYFLKTASTPADFAELGSLFREYANWLRIDANFPKLEEEIAGLPGEYSPPAGELMLALDSSNGAIGCVAVRPMQSVESCELKRLFVRRTSRSRGVGYALADAAVSFAASAGYRQMFLDTLPTMRAAISIYRSLGFEETAPYYMSPGLNALYFRKSFA